MVELVAYLAGQGEMIFEEFVSGARSEGLNPALWRRAKQSGLVSARLETNPETGVQTLYISAV